MTSRSTLLRLLLCVSATACHESPVAPASPPEGLPVLVRELSPAEQYWSGGPVIAQGDSVLLSAVLAGVGCVDLSPSAGVANGRLVVTITSRPLATVCSLEARSGFFRAVVRQAPRGRYTAVLRQRVETPTQAPQERELLRAPVVVP